MALALGNPYLKILYLIKPSVAYAPVKKKIVLPPLRALLNLDLKIAN